MGKIGGFTMPLLLRIVSSALEVLQVVLVIVIWGCLFGSKTVNYPNDVDNANNLTNAIVPMMLLCAIQLVMIGHPKYGLLNAMLSAAIAVGSLYIATVLTSQVICKIERTDQRRPDSSSYHFKCAHEAHKEEVAAVTFALIEMIVSLVVSGLLAIAYKKQKETSSGADNADYNAGRRANGSRLAEPNI